MALTAPTLSGDAEASLDDGTFGREPNEHLLHEVVKAELAARRQGTHATKSRGMVSGGRSKPWRQKGTGRARQGTTRAPQWTGGGTAFGPHPRSHAGKVNRKAHRAALEMALSSHAAAGSIAVVDAGEVAEPRTKRAVELLAGWRSERPLVVIACPGEEALARSFRNLARTHVVEPRDLEVADLLWARSLVVTRAALERLQGGA